MPSAFGPFFGPTDDANPFAAHFAFSHMLTSIHRITRAAKIRLRIGQSPPACEIVSTFEIKKSSLSLPHNAAAFDDPRYNPPGSRTINAR